MTSRSGGLRGSRRAEVRRIHLRQAGRRLGLQHHTLHMDPEGAHLLEGG